jgi:RND family efflux transporter MFP subunit
LTHISFLKNFKPLENGRVTASLITGADTVRQTLETPSQPGIYPFSLQALTAGTGKLVLDINTQEINSQIIVPDISVYAHEPDAQEAASKQITINNNGVHFPKAQSWKIDFATEEVRQEPFGTTIHTSAQILPSQSDERLITAKTNGIVSFFNDNIVDGKAVRAGQTLFTIEGGGLADNNPSVRYAEIENEYNKAKIEYERKKELAKDKIVSESELLNAQTEFIHAEIKYNNLQENFPAGKQAVVSPIAGFITRIRVTNGEYLEAGQTALVVSKNRNLLIKAELPSKYLPVLDKIISANIHVLNFNRTFSLEELDGKLLSFGKSTDINNPLIPVLFQVQNKAGLLSGSFVEMYIKTLDNRQAMTIPNKAIVEEMGNYFVFVQVTPEYFEKRLIKKGATDGLRTEITEGLSTGERIVSKGAILVKLAQAVGVDIHSGHTH